MTPYSTPEELVAAARQRETEARTLANAAALEYRRVVRNVVSEWRTQGISKRQAAKRLGITEGALRDLLRPEGVTRTASRARKTTAVRAGGA